MLHSPPSLEFGIGLAGCFDIELYSYREMVCLELYVQALQFKYCINGYEHTVVLSHFFKIESMDEVERRH